MSRKPAQSEKGKPKFEDTLPVDEEGKPSFDETIPLGEEVPMPAMEAAMEFDYPEEEISVPAPEYSDTPMDTISDIAVSAPQGITTWADEAQAGLQAGAKVIGGNKDPFMSVYESELKPIRERLDLARKRSPYASAASEIGTGIATSFVPGIGAGKMTQSLARAVGRGIFEGVGATEDKTDPTQLAVGSIGGGVGGAAAHGLGQVAQKFVGYNPNKTRASVMGAGASEFKEVGLKDRAAIAKQLKDLGLFGSVQKEWDMAKNKFVEKGKSLKYIQKPVKETLFQRLDEATNKIQNEKLKILGRNKNKAISIDSLEQKLDDVAKEFAGPTSGVGRSSRYEEASKVKDDIINDLLKNWEEKGGWDGQSAMGITVENLENLKMSLKNEVGKYGKNPLLAKTPNTSALYQDYYTAINKELRDLIPDAKYAQYNDLQNKFLTAQADLANAIGAEEGAKKGLRLPKGIIETAWGKTLGSEKSRLMGADIKDIADKFGATKATQYIGRPVAEELPYQGIRSSGSLFQKPVDTSEEALMEPGIDEQFLQDMQESADSEPSRNPSGEFDFSRVRPAFPQAWGLPADNNRKPMRPANIMITPREIIKYRIPLNSKAILADKERVLAKLVQNGVPDEMVDTFSQALNEDPDAISKAMPLIFTQFPTIFERSKYKVFDGKFIDPNDKAKAADDISKRDDLNSIQRAKMINKINKTGEMPEGL